MGTQVIVITTAPPSLSCPPLDPVECRPSFRSCPFSSHDHTVRALRGTEDDGRVQPIGPTVSTATKCGKCGPGYPTPLAAMKGTCAPETLHPGKELCQPAPSTDATAGGRGGRGTASPGLHPQRGPALTPPFLSTSLPPPPAFYPQGPGRRLSTCPVFTETPALRPRIT